MGRAAQCGGARNRIETTVHICRSIPTLVSFFHNLLEFFSFATASNDLKDLEEDQIAHYILNHLDGQDIYVVHTENSTERKR